MQLSLSSSTADPKVRRDSNSPYVQKSTMPPHHPTCRCIYARFVRSSSTADPKVRRDSNSPYVQKSTMSPHHPTRRCIYARFVLEGM